MNLNSLLHPMRLTEIHVHVYKRIFENFLLCSEVYICGKSDCIKPGGLPAKTAMSLKGLYGTKYRLNLDSSCLNTPVRTFRMTTLMHLFLN